MDLVRDASDPARTGKVVTPATRFTATSSYGVFVRMVYLLEETLGWNTTLAGTYREGNKTRNNWSENQKRRNILEWRHVINLHVLLHLFQERLNASFQLLGTNDHIVFRIGIPRRW